MKKNVALLLAVVLCLSLFAACGAKAEPTSFIGTWNMTKMEMGGETMNMADYAELGLVITMTLNEDKTASLDMYDEVEAGSWDVSGSRVKITFDEFGTMNGSLSGSTLTFKEGDTKLVFEAAN